MSLLKLDNLCKFYGEDETLVKAVDSVTLTVEEGEFIAILGASGSGKSTLLHMIGCVDEPTIGHVYLNGQDIYALNDNNQSKLRRESISIVYQFYNLIPTLNVVENITLPLDLSRKKVDQEYLDELLKLLKLEDRKKHLPNELSGGEQQRVAIGRALITRPSIILADEPTGNLDSKNSLEVMNILKRANEIYKQTIIMVTHDEELAKFAKRIITMKDGNIV
ncbi:MAG TPA: ABC transporter ATP-binding protein [Candidatus Onthocola stercorigallinarum]|nr:ABC transporter ATP-binding protein [Candidatus Onthocola stercorigallinarum]